MSSVVYSSVPLCFKFVLTFVGDRRVEYAVVPPDSTGNASVLTGLLSALHWARHASVAVR